MASMGRMRRRMAVCSLLQLMGAQLCPVLLELKHVSQIMTVAVRALKETPQFEVSASQCIATEMLSGLLCSSSMSCASKTELADQFICCQTKEHQPG